MAYSTAPTFPTFAGLTLPVQREPIWRSLHQVSIAGIDVAVQPWTYPRYRYKLPISFLRQAAAYAEMQSLMAFFHSVGGSAQVFQFTDPNDSVAASTSVTLGTGDSTNREFQSLRSFGGFIEPVFAVNTITKVFVGGSTVSTATFTMSNKGLITFSSTAIPTSTQTVQWLGTYNWFCRFDDDEMSFEQITSSSDAQGPLWGVREVKFSTLKFGV